MRIAAGCCSASPGGHLRQTGPRPAPAIEPAAAPAPTAESPSPDAASTTAAPPVTALSKPNAKAPSAAGPAPAAPSANGRGGFSMARQLGLRVGRIVIDAGHGGHDPGAQGPGTPRRTSRSISRCASRRLLAKEPGVEVVLTRRTDEYVALQERTAIANREGADLFVSIHVNASRNRSARGVETYLLNFASTPDAAAVAARENASSTLTMSHLNDLVKQIALNSKLDESRDLARHVQTRHGPEAAALEPAACRDLGVKQAPFVVLVGASMPSVLVEVAFLTHTQEGRLLGTGAYRQRIAESLLDGVRRYLRTLKRAGQPTPLTAVPSLTGGDVAATGYNSATIMFADCNPSRPIIVKVVSDADAAGRRSWTCWSTPWASPGSSWPARSSSAASSACCSSRTRAGRPRGRDRPGATDHTSLDLVLARQVGGTRDESMRWAAVRPAAIPRRAAPVPRASCTATPVGPFGWHGCDSSAQAVPRCRGAPTATRR